MNFIGELAALLTSISWSGTSVLFTKATQQVGSIIVNRVRVVIALIFLMSLNLAFYGYLLPFNASADRWVWFALSGAIGYALGDVFLFQSFLCIGAQRGMLMMSLAPLISAGLAWVFFDETLTGIPDAGRNCDIGRDSLGHHAAQERYYQSSLQPGAGSVVRAGRGHGSGSRLCALQARPDG